jgi:membrane dipeptidase
MDVTTDKLYADSIVIDACAPLASQNKNFDRYIKGRLTTIAATVLPVHGYLPETIHGIIEWYDNFRRDERLTQVLSVDDIYQAKKQQKLGVILAFQGLTHLQSDVGLVEVFYRLGIRQMLLCYNTKNAVGDGCEEPGDGGLSTFGEKVIKEMNRLGILVDLAHTGYRTTMEAMEASDKPMVFSHGNSRSVYESKRNLRDDQVIKVAKMGGTVGLNGFPAFLSANPRPKIDIFLDHLDYYVRLVGIDHVALGLDYYGAQAGIMPNDAAMKLYKMRLATGQWTSDTYPPPPYYYPEEIQLPEKFPNIVPALRCRGYADTDIRKILGENYLRVLKAVWK